MARGVLETAFFVRSARQWSDIVEKNPFSQGARKIPGKLAVVFLNEPASASAIRSLEGAITGNEYVSGAGGHVYVVYPDGIGRSRLTASVIEKALGGPGTARNWNTILKLQAAVSPARGAASPATAAGGRLRSVGNPLGLCASERSCTFGSLTAACGCGSPGDGSPAGDWQSR
jgi:hypothetical protein